MSSPEHSQRWEQKEGNMKRFDFTLQEFWERSRCPIFDAKTGKRIDDAWNFIREHKEEAENVQKEIDDSWDKTFIGG